LLTSSPLDDSDDDSDEDSNEDSDDSDSDPYDLPHPDIRYIEATTIKGLDEKPGNVNPSMTTKKKRKVSQLIRKALFYLLFYYISLLFLCSLLVCILTFGSTLPSIELRSWED
jgi:hypothetical protein